MDSLKVGIRKIKSNTPCDTPEAPMHADEYFINYGYTRLYNALLDLWTCMHSILYIPTDHSDP